MYLEPATRAVRRAARHLTHLVVPLGLLLPSAAVVMLSCTSVPVEVRAHPSVTDRLNLFDGEVLLAQWQWSDLEESAARFGAMRACYSDSPAKCVLATTQLARARGMAGDFDAAHALLDEAQALGVEEPLCRVRILLERGRVLRSAGDAQAAIVPFEEALTLAEDARLEYVTGDALHMLAMTAEGDAADSWMLRGIEACEAAESERAKHWLGPLLHNAWYARLQKDRFEEALGFAERARAHRAARDDDGGERIARWTVFHTHRRMGEVELACAGFETLLADYGEAGDPSGYTDEELGECLFALGRPEDAAPHFRTAFECLSADRSVTDADPERIARLERLGR